MITAVLFGEMAVVMSNLNRKNTRLNEILDMANTTMKGLGLSPDLMQKVTDHLIVSQITID